MGGIGSGERYGQYVKTTVEECDKLDLNWMVREGLFDHPGQTTGIITIHGSRDYKARFEFTLDLKSRFLDLDYTYDEEGIKYGIPLSRTPLPWGGQRWWMHCPLKVDGKPCRKRVAKLWRPRYSRWFGCRHCHDLTYYLCQRSHNSPSDGPRSGP